MHHNRKLGWAGGVFHVYFYLFCCSDISSSCLSCRARFSLSAFMSHSSRILLSASCTHLLTHSWETEESNEHGEWLTDSFLNFQPVDVSSVKYYFISDQLDVPSCESSDILGAEAALLVLPLSVIFPLKMKDPIIALSFNHNWTHLTKFNFNSDTLYIQCLLCCETDCFVEHPRIYLFVC